MVHFPTLPSPSYEFRGRYSGINQSGFPHSEIPGSKPACGSPGLIAACHVLHRLLAPRHSPYALSSLTKFSLTHCVCVVKELPIAGYSVVKELQSFRPSAFSYQPISHLTALRDHLKADRGEFMCAAASATATALEARRKWDAFAPSCENRYGEYRARTGDLLVANQALSQLS
jgi:hypothetical protein